MSYGLSREQNAGLMPTLVEVGMVGVKWWSGWSIRKMGCGGRQS